MNNIKTQFKTQNTKWDIPRKPQEYKTEAEWNALFERIETELRLSKESRKERMKLLGFVILNGKLFNIKNGKRID